MTPSDNNTQETPLMDEAGGAFGAETAAELTQVNPASAAYPHPIDAIVLSGTHTNPRRLIGGLDQLVLPARNEAFGGTRRTAANVVARPDLRTRAA